MPASVNFLAAAGPVPPMFALLAMLLVAVVLVSLMLSRARQSLLVGYFLCGVAVSNSGVLSMLGGADVGERISHMAEFGVILLMFTLGLEFSLGELRFLRRLALIGGGAQVLLTMLIVMAVALALGLPWQQSLTLGAALTLSSTAVSVKVFQDQGLAGSPGARMALAVAIFQDLFVIGFFLFLPLLFPAAESKGLLSAMGALTAAGVAFLALAWVLAKWVIPRLLHAVARTRNRELFTLTVVGLCVGLAYVGGMMKLSLALGAFVAGLAVSESIYKHRILADVMPIKDLFLTLFFVSVGLMIDLRVAAAHWHEIALVTALLMAGKTALVAWLGSRLGLPGRASLLAALSLSSAGEFSLVLLQRVGDLRPWPAATLQIWLASVALSMGLVPSAMRLANPIADWMRRRGWCPTRAPLPEGCRLSERVKHLEDHAIICGYGPVGQSLVAALEDAGVPTLIIELNADTVKSLHGRGRPVLFADATHEETWELARVGRARLVAFSFPLPHVAAHALPYIRQRRPEVAVLARCRFSSDAERLLSLGVDRVIHDETETGRAITREALVACEPATS